MADWKRPKLDSRNLKIGVPDVIIGSTVVMQILLLTYLNLFKLRDLIDVDMAKHMRHSIEMSRSGIIIPFWKYLTYGEIDNTCLFAAPIYKFTGDIFFAFGLVNIIAILFFAMVICRIISNLRISKRVLLIVLLVSLTPTSLGMLGYLKCTFLGGGYYAFRFITPLLLLAVITTPKERRRSWFNIIMIVICALMILTTSMSSSLFVFGIAIIPIILCYVILQARDGIRKYVYEDIVIGISLFMTAAGLCCNKIFEIRSNTSGMIIRASEEGIIQDIERALLSLCKILIGSNTDVDGLFSLEGVFYVSACMGAIIVFGFGLSAIPRVLFIGSCKDEAATRNLESILITMFVWSFFVNVVTDTSLRYQLIGFYPLLIVAAIRMESFFTHMSVKSLKTMCAVVFVGLYAVVTMINGMRVAVSYTHQYDGIRNTCDKIIELVNDRKCGVIYFYEWHAMPEMLRLYDPDNLYLTINSETGTPEAADFYYSVLENTAVSQHNLVVINEESGGIENVLPDLSSDYTYVDCIDGYAVYESFINKFDGISGLPLEGTRAVDFSDSPGYIFDEQEHTLTSPVINPSGNCSVIITTDNSYDATGICIDHGELMSIIENDGITESTFRLQSGESCVVVFNGLTDSKQVISLEYRSGS
ncbi:hypothetical protein SAMN02910456_01394 [Ruminococcaceae bacterium YRB3002]|nr:hypothetical protein SAMN02910456_01394 [Ruminococcaceae bacterium YRB3002]